MIQRLNQTIITIGMAKTKPTIAAQISRNSHRRANMAAGFAEVQLQQAIISGPSPNPGTSPMIPSRPKRMRVPGIGNASSSRISSVCSV